jgi:hypothetical protein
MDIPILVLHLVISKSIRGSLKVYAHSTEEPPRRTIESISARIAWADSRPLFPDEN